MPPPYASPPEDPALRTRITKLAEYYARNGPAFEELLKNKQKENPEYAFLFGGTGCEFYAWCLFCLPRGLPIESPLPADYKDLASALNEAASTGTVPPGAPPGATPEMPPEVSSGFRQVLELLNGSQESIKASSAWFMACSMHAAGMADMMLQRLQSLPDFTSQLHIIYLMNDIFFTGPRMGQQVDQRMTAVFLPRIGPALTAAYATSGRSPEALVQLQQLLSLWSSRGIFAPAEVEQMTAALQVQGPGAVAAPHALPVPSAAPVPPNLLVSSAPQLPHQFPGPQSAPPHAVPPQRWPTQNQPVNVPAPWAGPPNPGFTARAPNAMPWGPQHHNQFMQPPVHAHMPPPAFPGGPGGPSVPPPGMHGPPRPGWLPPHDAPMYPSQRAHSPPPPEPYDILSFPAGIIPKLLRRHLRYETPYTPLTPDDVDQEPPPPLPEKDSYMKSRLDRYYAEVAEYRPGLSRAKYEETRKQGADTVDPREALAERNEREVSRRNDGSYTGGPELERGGLGSHTAAQSNADDMYATYRRNRSGRYHEIMASKSTNPNRPPYGH